MFGLVYLGAVLLALAHSLTTFDFSSVDNLTTAVSTSSEYLFVGEELNVTCDLNKWNKRENCKASDITFLWKDPHTGSQRNLTSTVVNESVSMLIIPHVTAEDAGNYECHVWDCKDGAVGTTDSPIEIEYAPHNVTNFKCIAYNWDEYLQCTWQHPVQYIHEEDVTVTVHYSPYSNSSVCRNANWTSCTLTDKNCNDCLADFRKTFEVTVNNTRRNINATAYFFVNMWKIVKPAPVEGLKVDPYTVGCFNVSWSHEKTHRLKIYRVTHYAPGENNGTMVLTNDTFYVTCGYAPYTSHRFTVEVSPTNSSSGYWSEPVSQEGKTLTTAPGLGPETTNGSFTTTECENGQRSVTVFWQKVKESETHGEIDFYQIKVEEKVILNVSVDDHSKQLQLPCGSSKVSILAHNKAGLSLVPSVLIIPPTDFTVPEVTKQTFSVEIQSNFSKDFLRAEWEESEDNLNYTIFWCDGWPSLVCEDEMHWIPVPASQTFFDMDLPGSDARQFWFGLSVSSTTKGWASGISWTGCLYQRNAPKIPPPENMEVQGEFEDVSISWDRIQCSYQNQIKVTNYRVKWCQKEKCNETYESEEVSGMSSFYKLSKLEAKIPYLVTVQAVSHDAVGEEAKPWKTAILNEKESLNIWAVIGGLMAATVLISFGIFVYRRCYQSRKRAMELLRPMTLPEVQATPSPTPPPRVCPTYQSPTFSESRLMSVPGTGEVSHAQSMADSDGQDHGESGDSFANGIFPRSGEPLVKRGSQRRVPKSPEEAVPMVEVTGRGMSAQGGANAQGMIPKAVSPRHVTEVQQSDLPVFSPWSNGAADQSSSPGYCPLPRGQERPQLSDSDKSASQEESVQSYIRVANTSTENDANSQPLANSTALVDLSFESNLWSATSPFFGLQDHVVFMTHREKTQPKHSMVAEQHAEVEVQDYVTVGDMENKEVTVLKMSHDAGTDTTTPNLPHDVDASIPKTLQDSEAGISHVVQDVEATVPETSSVMTITNSTPAVLGHTHSMSNYVSALPLTGASSTANDCLPISTAQSRFTRECSSPNPTQSICHDTYIPHHPNPHLIHHSPSPYSATNDISNFFNNSEDYKEFAPQSSEITYQHGRAHHGENIPQNNNMGVPSSVHNTSPPQHNTHHSTSPLNRGTYLSSSSSQQGRGQLNTSWPYTSMPVEGNSSTESGDDLIVNSSSASSTFQQRGHSDYVSSVEAFKRNQDVDHKNEPFS